MACFPFPINIVKQTNGNVFIYNVLTGDFVKSLSSDIIKIQCNENELVKLTMDNGSLEFFDPALVVNLQILPNPAVLFVGDCTDLSEELSTNFFFELTGGGGGSQDLDDVLSIGNNAGIYDIDLNNNELLNTDKIDFNLATSNTAGVGQLVWNDTDGTLDLGLKGGNVTLQLGQEEIIRIVNKTNGNLLESEYKCVRIRTQAEGGAQGQRLAVKLAQANTKANHSGILGLVTENINNNQEGFITTFGYVRNINTTGSLQGESWVDGDALWLSDTVAGQLTNIEPLTHPVQIGWVVYAHGVNGKIFVKVQEGVDELGELHDVTFPTAPANNDILVYNSSNSRWENKTSDGFNIIVKSANQDVNNTTLTDDTDFQFPVVAGGNYMLTMILATSSDSSLNDYKFAFAVSSGTINGVGNIVCRNAGNSGTVTVISAASTSVTNSVVIGQNTGSIPNVSGIVTAIVDFGFYASANATVKFQFALNSGVTTARTWKGSVLKYKRLD